MLHPPNLRIPSTRRDIAIATALVAGCLAGCAVQADESHEWREVSQAAPGGPSESNPPSDTPSSLGDPFLLIAQGPNLALRASDTHPSPSNPAVESSWAMLSSDSCDVVLRSLYISFRQEQGAPLWLATDGPIEGVVQEATASSAVVRYRGSLRMAWPSARPETIVSAVIVVAMDRAGDEVSLSVNIAWDSEGTPVLTGFGARAWFNEDPEAVPPRRFGCW